MAKCGFGYDDFRIEEVHDFESMIRADCYCEEGGFAYLLVDTPKRPNGLVLNMVQRSDLIIVPFRNASEAALSSKWLTNHLKNKQIIYGLATAIETDDDYVLARSAFIGFPVLDILLKRKELCRKGTITCHSSISVMIHEHAAHLYINLLISIHFYSD